jgi:hypothetical protein
MFKKYQRGAWTGLIWLRAGANGGVFVKTVMQLRISQTAENLLTK